MPWTPPGKPNYPFDTPPWKKFLDPCMLEIFQKRFDQIKKLQFQTTIFNDIGFSTVT